MTRGGPLLAAAGLLAALMIGFRFEVGADWFNYKEMFEYAAYVNLFEILALADPGYNLLNWLAQAAGTEVWTVNLVCALIFVWGLLKFCNHQPNPWLALVVAVPYLVIVVAMGYTRQGVAIGIILAGLATIERTSIIRFSFYILAAAAFHKSAIVILPLVGLASVKQRLPTVLLMLLLGLTIYYLFVERAMTMLTAAYIEQEYDSAGAIIRVGMNMVPAVIYLLFQKRFALSALQQKLWRNFALAALATVPMVFLTVSSTIVDRVALYLIPLQLFVFSRLPMAFPDKHRPNMQVALGVIFYSAAVQAIWLTMAGHARYWLPYTLYPFFDR